MLGLSWTKLEEQRSLIKFLLLEGEKLRHIFQRLQTSFSKACISFSTFYSWVSQLREDMTSMREKLRPGRLVEAMTPTMVGNVEAFVNKGHKSDIAGGS